MKNMKKAAALLLVLSMLASAAACSETAQNADETGRWTNA